MLFRVAQRLPRPGFRVKLAAVALLGPAASLAAFALRPQADAMAAAISLIGVSLAMIGLAVLMVPIGRTADELHAAVGGEGEAQGMLADAQALTARLRTLQARLTDRHPITGLPTREPFLARLADEIGPAGATGVLAAVRIADYEDLAAFDRARADRALAAFAARLAGASQPGRAIAHIDRDCFAVWLQGASRQAAAGELQALAYVLSQELGDDEAKIGPDARLGAAVFPVDAPDASTLLSRAVAAIPKAALGASGRVGFHAAPPAAAVRERFSIEQGLRHAIARDQFLLHYQPVFDLSARRAVGAEALLRWRHPDLGLLTPARFLPVLEQSGLMEEVGLWVLNAACRQARAWKDEGLTGLTMAVNLSARQCRDPAFATVVLRTLQRHNLEPEALELELTETAAMEDAERTRTLLGELRSLGVGVALDDFGAGYSSLAYLKNLPFSKLKIDREFVTLVDRRRDSRAICSALVALARGLDITILAEGVETRQEVETLRKMGCSMFQGFFLARPGPAADFAAAIADPAWRKLAAPARRRASELAGGVAA